MSRYWEKLQISIVFFGNKFSSRLDTEVPKVYPKAEVAKGRRAFCRQTWVQRDHWLYLVKNSSVLGSKIFLASLGKNVTKHQKLYSLCLVVIDSKMVSRELLGPAKSARKTVRALEFSVSNWRRISALVNVPPNQWPLQICQVFEIFRTWTIFRLFDNLDESTTISSALPIFSTTSSVSSSLGAKLDDPVIFNIEVSSAAIHLKPWMKRQ